MTRLQLVCETYLVWQSVCSKLSQGELEASILSIVQSYLDSDRRVGGRGWVCR